MLGCPSMSDRQMIFVDIDTQRDFLDPDGALYVPGSKDIRANLERLTRSAIAWGIPIVATACAHSPEDDELTRFPAHCMVGTAGQTRIPETTCAETVVLGVDQRFQGAIPSHVTLEKRELDVFSRPDTTSMIRRYNESKPTFVVYGVATDYCVRAAVLGLLERRVSVAIVVDAVRAIDAGAEPALLTEFARKGGVLTVVDHVLRAHPTHGFKAEHD